MGRATTRGADRIGRPKNPEFTGPDRAAFEEAAFKGYQDAFHRLSATPNLRNAVALVRAWNVFAQAVGVETFDVGSGRK
jgi:hypothetical protein